MGVNPSQSRDTIQRRTFLSALAATSGAAMAGCTGDDAADEDDGDQELGERVSDINMEFYAGIPGLSEEHADVSEIIQRNIQDGLDITLDIAPKQVGTLVVEVFNDAREQNLMYTADSLEPHRLDPNELLLGESVMSAGADVGYTQTNYASCEYSELAHEQLRASDEAEREDIVHEALSVASHDICGINITDYVVVTTYRSDQITITSDEPPAAGIAAAQADLLLNHVELADGYDTLAYDVNQDYVTSPNPWTQDNPTAIRAYNEYFATPLIRYDRNFELQNVLATDYEVLDDFERVVVTIRDHVDENGTPVTAEDVKWTYELVDEYAGSEGAFVRAASQPYESIDVLDDNTVEFTFTRPNPAFVTAHMPTWGVFPMDFWVDQGVDDADHPTDVDVHADDFVSSGPYVMEQFVEDDFALLSPNDQHWNTPDYDMRMQHFRDGETAIRTFEAGDVNILGTVPDVDYAARVEDDDDIESIFVESYTRAHVAAQHSFGPTKFEEFRLALSQCINRAEINEVVYHNTQDVHLHSCIFGPGHPYYPDDHEGLRQITPSAEGDPEVARETLESHGWGWDDDGNLRYPPDADLEPLWPQGENPQAYPDEWPCVDELDAGDL